MTRWIMLAIPAWLLLAGAALGQTSNYRSSEVAPGTSIRLGFYAVAKRNCTAGPLVEVRVVEPPKHGILTVRRARLTINRIPSCPNLIIPAQVVFYQASQGYHGTDEVSYEVTRATGQQETNTVAILVTDNPKTPVPKEPPSPDKAPTDTQL